MALVVRTVIFTSERVHLISKVLVQFLRKLRCPHNLPGPGGRSCKLCSVGRYSSYERDACINFREGLFVWKLEVLVIF